VAGHPSHVSIVGQIDGAKREKLDLPRISHGHRPVRIQRLQGPAARGIRFRAQKTIGAKGLPYLGRAYLKTVLGRSKCVVTECGAGADLRTSSSGTPYSFFISKILKGEYRDLKTAVALSTRVIGGMPVLTSPIRR